MTKCETAYQMTLALEIRHLYAPLTKILLILNHLYAPTAIQNEFGYDSHDCGTYKEK